MPLVVRTPLGDWLAAPPDPVRGVFLTHHHPDDLTGLADVAPARQSAGPGEAEERRAAPAFFSDESRSPSAGRPEVLHKGGFRRAPGVHGFLGSAKLFGVDSFYGILGLGVRTVNGFCTCWASRNLTMVG